MNIAIIENNTIVNVIVSDVEWARQAFPNNEVIECPLNAGVGWRREGGSFTAPGALISDQVNAHQITRRQGLIALFDEQNIKEGDVQAVIDAIEDPKQQYRAQVEFNNQNWEIDNEYVQQFAAALEITPERLQELFNIADTL